MSELYDGIVDMLALVVDVVVVPLQQNAMLFNLRGHVGKRRSENTIGIMLWIR